MPAPATTGVLRTLIKDMKIGDYIVVAVNNSLGGYQFGINTSGYTERPVTGMSGSQSGYYWYGIKVDKGLIISDRVTTHTTSWDTQNTAKNIEGQPITPNGGVDSISELRVRSLTGGVAYADANGNKILTDQGFGGWPTNNEWDRYIVNFPTGKIQSGKTSDDVFHMDRGVNPSIPNTLCQETPALGTVRVTDGVVATNTTRTARIKSSAFPSSFNLLSSSTSSDAFGFRPVFEYKE